MSTGTKTAKAHASGGLLLEKFWVWRRADGSVELARVSRWSRSAESDFGQVVLGRTEADKLGKALLGIRLEAR